MFTKILIANRGEIACRVAATARRLGIRTVAVYSDADKNSKHVAACDEAVYLGPAPARESYLKGDAIIAAALATGAQAIHPGYGFLSENADFADQCAAASIRFIGPPASAIRAMGSKSAAKSRMEAASVPLVPGYHAADQDPGVLHAAADRIGYPVLIKASAGGGGKGMRIVEKSADFVAALSSCQREARASFGDDLVLIEKYLQRPRHIEIQVFADRAGECVYLFERDCSVQRRHQKVLEEAPAPGLTNERRQAMGQAAVAAAKAVGYEGAGTVEFIVNQDGTFYFMEMNTRLQVEHPVTEMITGLDLVEWQLRIANGEPLPKRQDELRIYGHAIEARLYAENPERGFLPSTGTLALFDVPAAIEFSFNADLEALHEPASVRMDGGVRQGDAITPYYDPMIAKLITWGADRDQALARMGAALREVRISGLSTNVAFLQRLIASTAFSSADLDTGLIERNHALLFPAPAPATPALVGLAIAAVLAGEEKEGAQGPWAALRGWRMNLDYRRSFAFTVNDQSVTATLIYRTGGIALEYDGVETPFLIEKSPAATAKIALGGPVASGAALVTGPTVEIFQDGGHTVFHYIDPLAFTGTGEANAGRLTAPMPGKVVSVACAVGATVAAGDPLIVMEAMKMEHTITAPMAGVVEAIHYAAGDQVQEGVQLLTLKAAAV